MNVHAQSDLWGLKVLIVEDSAPVAMRLEDMLQEAGCEIIGPVGRIEEAMDIARSGDLDVAVLDINVQGAKVFGVADELQRRGIPFIFSTGSGTRHDPAVFRDALCLSKPFKPENLWSAISAARRQHLQSARYGAT
jgi:DNA-binding response OmpR family regulator